MSRKWDRIKAGWYLWIFPLAALVITVWLVRDFKSQRGPMIKINFDDAAGIQPGKTQVRFRGVAIGTVEDVHISLDQKDAVVEVVLRKEAEHFAVEGSKFSLVVPKVNFQGISGLETLFEGTYIAVLPGSAEGRRKTEFKAQPMQATDPLDDTSAYLIIARNVESINAGDAVSYRGLKVGSVTKLTLQKDSRSVLVQINIENRYVRTVRTNTVFWKKAGVQAKFGLFGSEIKVNSMDSIVNGGIEYATPNEAGAQAKAMQGFELGDAAPKEVAQWNPILEGAVHSVRR